MQGTDARPLRMYTRYGAARGPRDYNTRTKFQTPRRDIAAWDGSAHHVPCITPPQGQFRHCRSTVPPGTARSHGGGGTRHETVQARERNELDGNLTQVAI